MFANFFFWVVFWLEFLCNQIDEPIDNPANPFSQFELKDV